LKSDPLYLLPLKLNPDDDLKIKLGELFRFHNVEAAFIISGIGSLKTLRLRLANSNQVFSRDESFEILSLQGSVSLDGLHLHLSVANSSGQVFGGHLIEGSLVYTTAEILVAKCHEYVFSRQNDPATGYKELQIHKKS
jgi:predicted DNA-binding protein with PD1-like motif